LKRTTLRLSLHCGQSTPNALRVNNGRVAANYE
jgi:hypothetical protein